MTEEERAERLAYWMKVLRLQDWTVLHRTRRKYEMDTDHQDCLAYVEVYENKKEAHITFLDPGDHDPDGWPQEDEEQSLVHELVHLHLWAFNPKEDTPEWTAMEQATHALARALIALDRKKRRSDE